MGRFASTTLPQALRDHHTRRTAEQDRIAWLPTGLVFSGPHGLPQDGTGVTRRFQALLKAAGLPRLSFHDLRHSTATVLLAQHVPARVVMERLRHSSIAMTMNIYSHVIAELNQDAADPIDRVLGGTQGS